MEDCRTPTYNAPREFKFNLTPTAMNPNVLHYQDIKNVVSSRRSFTPVHANFRSPSLSPIYKLPVSPLTAHHSSSFMEFKKPTLLVKPIATYTHSPKYGGQQTFLSPCPAFNNNFPTSPNYKAEEFNGRSPQFEDSKSSVLNHNINIKLLLKTLGMERYCKNFEKAGIDCRTLLDIKSCDLKNIGIKSDEDRDRIMEMLQNVFST